ncbi:squalene--hopene cyclase [Oceanobacillus timonensis]|uniref:squalene--hopene cyclase n=1 Tax=Oceanobacillus timonensis TaxID=1926285 RepID=UPI0009BB733A|nr:squalene--hopene cyclase [Oceanobacillus timonensis]
MKEKVDVEINRLVDRLTKEQEHDGSWAYPFETGISTDCYMIILLRTLEMDDEDLIDALVSRILRKQGKNGAWKIFHDEGEGNLTATVEACYALLYSGHRKKEDREIRLATRFIQRHGGLKEINMFAKVMLALTGQYKWPRYLPVPVQFILFPVSFPLNLFDLSLYARSNLVPILITADYKFSRKTKRSPDLSYLFLQRGDDGDWEAELNDWRSFQTPFQRGIGSLIGNPEQLHELALQRAEDYMLNRRESDGTFYSYFSATFLMIFALMARGYSKKDPIITKAVEGLKSFQTNIGKQTHMQYTMANVWNTALISHALQKAGVPSSSTEIKNANQYLLGREQMKYGDWAIHNPDVAPGGWGFSNINTFNPDLDDTTASLRSICSFASNTPVYRQAWDRGIQWAVSMQNDDGGWPAFEKNVDNTLLSWLPIEGGGSMLLDPSTADLTGRTLEFFGNDTHTDTYQPFIKRAVKWLLHNQEKDGSWYGRWGICYIYGTWSAITGLAAVKTCSNHPQVQQAIQWLYAIQNQDGGWGESCKSDIEKKYVPLKESTRTHTAWALDALIAAEEKATPEIKRGISYLLETSEKADWTTAYPKGQGLPGGFYIHYHSYEYLFPLLALANYREKF